MKNSDRNKNAQYPGLVARVLNGWHREVVEDEVQPLDILSRPTKQSKWLAHDGIVTKSGNILHLQAGDDGRLIPTEEPFSVFSRNGRVYRVRKPLYGTRDRESQEEVLQQLVDGDMQYKFRLFSTNCQGMTTKGVSKGPPVGRSLILAISIAGAIANGLWRNRTRS